MELPPWVTTLQPSDPQGTTLLAQERRKSSLDIGRVAKYLYTEEGLKRQARLLSILTNDAAFDKTLNYFESRVERYRRSLKRARHLNHLREEHAWDEGDLLAAIELIGEPTSLTLHWTMFIVSCPRFTNALS